MYRRSLLCLFAVGAVALYAYAGDGPNFKSMQPRPSGFGEANAAPGPRSIEFGTVRKQADVLFDVVAHFPKNAAPSFHVDKVTLNGAPVADFLVANLNIYNGHRVVHGTEDFTVSLNAQWKPNAHYKVEVDGATEDGKPVHLAAVGSAPGTRGATSLSFAGPTFDSPYHQVTLTVPKEIVAAGKVKSVEVDGKKARDVRYFNTEDPTSGYTVNHGVPEGESYEGVVDGKRDFRVTTPLYWLNGSHHAVKVTVTGADGKDIVYKADAKAPASGGYWSAEWPHCASLTVEESAGMVREQEPVHANVGLFADDITKPENEIRVITYDPTNPKAGADGWVIAPSQVTNVTVWRDERLLNSDEKDPETGEPVHRYDATTSVELVFSADVAAYEKKVYYVVYGNPKAEKPKLETDLKVVKSKGMSQTIDNASYSYYLSENSGSVETISIKGEGEPIKLEHKLETNGAVHWNPDIYSPPTPWVHISDWETPIYDEISGPLMHRTRRYAPLPHMDSVDASVSYEFYAGKPYVLMTSFMEVQKDMFVQALRNAEIVFNHAILNEFVWQDELGTLKSLDVNTAKKHPIHALEIPADTPWMALINREKQVGFASINVVYENGNRYGQPVSDTQPYIYVQNGPWVYVARPNVYPFGGNNFTRMMPVRAGSFYHEENAWLAFRFAKGDDPFADVKKTQKLLTNPLRVRDWMATDNRTPEKWVMPILTMPFNEGVAGAVSGHKAVDDKAKKE